MCTHVLPSFVKETARCFDLNGVFIIFYKQLVFSGTLIDSLGCDGRGEVVMSVASTLLNTFKLWCEWS